MAKGIADKTKQRINSLKLRHVFRPRHRHNSSLSSHLNPSANLTLKPTKGHVQLLDLMAFIAVFALSFIAGSFFLIPLDSQAVTGLTLVSPNASISASVTPGDLSTSITPTASGTIVSAQQTVTTNTDMPTGYNLSLEQTNTSTNATAALKPTTGTLVAPTALSNNTWGFAIAKVSSNTTNNTITNGFDSTYTTPNPSTSSLWANPATQSTIKDRRAATSDTGDSTTIYYAAKADLSAPVGTSSFTMRYTATTNISLLPTPTISSITATSGPTQSTNTGSTAGGTQIAIVGTGFTSNDTSITHSVKLGSDNCLSVTISSNTPSAGQDTIYCTTPAHPTAEAITVTVGTWGGTATKASGFTYIAPTPTITAPTDGTILSAGTTAQTITVTTDLPAICYYGTTATPATKMSTTGSDTTGATIHSQTITSLTNASAHTYYIRCQAKTSHSYGANKSVTFYVRTATPTAPTLSPASGTTVDNGTTTITVTSSGATCKWGTASGTYGSNSGTTRTTTTGTNTLYYSCTAGSGNTVSDAKTGSWSYTGKVVAATGDVIQSVYLHNCPTTATRVNDARDNNSYWVKKIGNQCWMLTNLAYAGGGTNTYGDTKSISNGESASATHTTPYYYIPTGSSVTTGTTNPSSSTTGTGQYGYLYNFCAANGAQTNTSACLNTASPAHDTSISICPRGWRLPSSGSSSADFGLLNTNANSGSTSSDSGLLTNWYAMYNGIWNNAFRYQNDYGYYWSSTLHSGSYEFGYHLFFNDNVEPSSGSYRHYALAVRCVNDSETPAQPVTYIQTITTANCPTMVTKVNDARDDSSYWVKKIGTQCWMLTNLAYAGGGTNTYGDVKTITNSNSQNYTAPYYMIPTGANPTNGTAVPSTSINGTGQYGYLYNFCAANGAQANTSACLVAETPAHSTSISICPKGWRLPTGVEFGTLNTNANSGSTSSPSGLMTNWYAMYNGYWVANEGFINQGSYGHYWSSTQFSGDPYYGYILLFSSSSVSPSYATAKYTGNAVRCVAN